MGGAASAPEFLFDLKFVFITHFKSFNGNFQFSDGFQISTQHYQNLDTSLKKLLNKPRGGGEIVRKDCGWVEN